MSLSFDTSKLQLSAAGESREGGGITALKARVLQNASYHPTELHGKRAFLFLYLFVQISSGSLYLLYSTSISTLTNMQYQPQKLNKKIRLVAHSFSSLYSHIIMKEERDCQMQ